MKDEDSNNSCSVVKFLDLKWTELVVRLPVSCQLLRAGKLLPVEEFLPQRVLLNLFQFFKLFLDLLKQFGKSYCRGECDYSLGCNLLQALSLLRARFAAVYCSENCLKTYARICFPACSCLD